MRGLRPIGEPGNRVCAICAGHESEREELQDDMVWTQTPTIRVLSDRRQWVMTQCWDDLTRDLRDHIANQDHDIAQLRNALQDAVRLLDMADAAAKASVEWKGTGKEIEK